MLKDSHVPEQLRTAAPPVDDPCLCGAPAAPGHDHCGECGAAGQLDPGKLAAAYYREAHGFRAAPLALRHTAWQYAYAASGEWVERADRGATTAARIHSPAERRETVRRLTRAGVAPEDAANLATFAPVAAGYLADCLPTNPVRPTATATARTLLALLGHGYRPVKLAHVLTYTRRNYYKTGPNCRPGTILGTILATLENLDADGTVTLPQ